MTSLLTSFEANLTKFFSLENTLARFPGTDSHGDPKSNYIYYLFNAPDEVLAIECEEKIWKSVLKDNKPNSVFHYQCEICFIVSQSRDKDASIYKQAHEKVTKQINSKPDLFIL